MNCKMNSKEMKKVFRNHPYLKAPIGVWVDSLEKSHHISQMDEIHKLRCMKMLSQVIHDAKISLRKCTRAEAKYFEQVRELAEKKYRDLEGKY